MQHHGYRARPANARKIRDIRRKHTANSKRDLPGLVAGIPEADGTQREVWTGGLSNIHRVYEGDSLGFMLRQSRIRCYS